MGKVLSKKFARRLVASDKSLTALFHNCGCRNTAATNENTEEEGEQEPEPIAREHREAPHSVSVGESVANLDMSCLAKPPPRCSNLN